MCPAPMHPSSPHSSLAPVESGGAERNNTSTHLRHLSTLLSRHQKGLLLLLRSSLFYASASLPATHEHVLAVRFLCNANTSFLLPGLPHKHPHTSRNWVSNPVAQPSIELSTTSRTFVGSQLSSWSFSNVSPMSCSTTVPHFLLEPTHGERSCFHWPKQAVATSSTSLRVNFNSSLPLISSPRSCSTLAHLQLSLLQDDFILLLFFCLAETSSNLPAEITLWLDLCTPLLLWTTLMADPKHIVPDSSLLPIPISFSALLPFLFTSHLEPSPAHPQRRLSTPLLQNIRHATRLKQHICSTSLRPPRRLRQQPHRVLHHNLSDIHRYFTSLHTPSALHQRTPPFFENIQRSALALQCLFPRGLFLPTTSPP